MTRFADVHRAVDKSTVGTVKAACGSRFEWINESGSQVIIDTGLQLLHRKEAIRQLAGIELILDLEGVVPHLVLDLLQPGEVEHLWPGRCLQVVVADGRKLDGEELRIVLQLVQNIVW